MSPFVQFAFDGPLARSTLKRGDKLKRDRKSTQGFCKRRRTESGGRVRPGRHYNETS
jgi:hypothetical protein